MKKKITIIMIGILLMPLILSTVTTQARLDGLNIGDTFKYTVTDFDFPSYNFIYEDPEELPYDPNDFQIDLTGSVMGIKIMDIGTDGYYGANQYIVLDKPIQIPVPYYSEATASENDMHDIFGDTITIPSGVGIGLGMTATLSDLLDTINNPDSNNYYYYSPSLGLFMAMSVLYLEPTEWDTYEEYFLESGENHTDSDSSVVTYIDVTRTSSEFIVVVSTTRQSTYDDVQWGYSYTYTNELRISWYTTGTNAGLLARQSTLLDNQYTHTGTENMDRVDSHTHQEMEIQFESRENIPLPLEVRTQEDITLKLEEASVVASASGFFDEEQVSDGLTFLTDELAGAVGKDVLKFEIESVQGCYYETSLHMYDSGTQSLVEQPGTVWWNGFTGYPTFQDNWYYSGDDPPLNYWSGSIAIVPFSPAITPDYDMWRGTTKSIDAIFQALNTAVLSSPAEELFADVGIVVSDFELYSELRTTGNYKYIYLYGGVEVNYNSNAIDPSKRSSSWIADQTVTFYLDLDAWISYTLQGLIAGVGINVDFEFEFTNLQVDEEYDGSYWVPVYDDGSFDLTMSMKLQNTKFSDVPPASEAVPDLGDNGGGLIPSFTLVTAMAVLVFSSAYIRRKRR